MRLWINSLTDAAIKDGLNNLQNDSNYDNLFIAAKARSEADWLVGMNATQACSIMGKSLYSIGRVQTPTFVMIVERYLQNKDFKSVPFWQADGMRNPKQSEPITQQVKQETERLSKPRRR